MVKGSRRVGLYLCALGVVVVGNAAPVAAQAATAAATIAVSATVLSLCTISATALAFGNYNQVVVNQTATLSITCTNGTTYSVALDNGTGAGATPAVRKMTLTGGNTLNYGLFSDSGHNTVWGSTVPTNTVAGTGSGGPQTLTVYGQIPAGQFSAPGAYTDTVTATLTY